MTCYHGIVTYLLCNLVVGVIAITLVQSRLHCKINFSLYTNSDSIDYCLSMKPFYCIDSVASIRYNLIDYEK